jgi:hypothetical protein
VSREKRISVLGMGFGAFLILFATLLTGERVAIQFSPFTKLPQGAEERLESFRLFFLILGFILYALSLASYKGFLDLRKKLETLSLRLTKYSSFLGTFGIGSLWLAPPLFFHFQDPLLLPFKLLAADAFYYLTVAQNFTQTQFFTFDTIHPTNGFHPLWQYTLAFLFFWKASWSLEDQIFWTFWFQWALVGLSLRWWVKIVYRKTASYFWVFITFFPGFYYALVLGIEPRFGTLWSFLNGMESAYVLFFGAACLFRIQEKWPTSPRQAFFLGVLLSALVLSRLDEIFLYLVVFFFVERERKGLGKYLLFPGLFNISLYLFYNFQSTGMFLPVSGQFKQGLGFLSNFYFMLEFFLPSLLLPLNLYETELSFWFSTSWRMLQLGFPLGVALLVYGILGYPLLRDVAQEERARRGENRFERIVSAYLLLKGFYHFFCVGIWHQGSWYNPLCLVGANVLISFCLYDQKSKFSLAFLRGGQFFLGAMSLIFLHVFWLQQSASSTHERLYEWFQRREFVQEILDKKAKGEYLLAFEDGILAYTLKRPTMNGLGLCLDQAGAQAKKEGRLLEDAYQKGFRILCTLTYNTWTPQSTKPLELYLQEVFYLAAERPSLGGWEFELLYFDWKSQAIFLKFFPKIH